MYLHIYISPAAECERTYFAKTCQYTYKLVTRVHAQTDHGTTRSSVSTSRAAQLCQLWGTWHFCQLPSPAASVASCTCDSWYRARRCLQTQYCLHMRAHCALSEVRRRATPTAPPLIRVNKAAMPLMRVIKAAFISCRRRLG